MGGLDSGRWADIIVFGMGDASARPGMGDVQCLEVYTESGQISQLSGAASERCTEPKRAARNAQLGRYLDAVSK